MTVPFTDATPPRHSLLRGVASNTAENALGLDPRRNK